MIYDLVFFWITANLILGAFNMLPFGPLDGAKIKDWNEGVWFAFFTLFVGLSILMVFGIWNAMSIAVLIAELF
jgi:Zn-dependent protease